MPTFDLARALEDAADLVDDEGVTPLTAVNRVAAKLCGGPEDGTALGLELPSTEGAASYPAVYEALVDAVERGGAPPLERLPADFRGVHILRNAAQWANQAESLARTRRGDDR